MERGVNPVDLPRWSLLAEQPVDAGLFGNKARNLADLRQRGLRVPPALLLMRPDPEVTGFADRDAYLAAIGGLATVLAEILPADHGWAVRSSATVEDAADTSLAGRFETLFIDRADQLARAVGQVWDSAALAGFGQEIMGVVVQPLLAPAFAGVAFSTDPVDGATGTVAEICRGRGDRLVDGSLTPWRVRFADQRHRLPVGLDAAALAELDRGVQRLADELGYPVDVEWALQNDVLYWLQLRPLTTSAPPAFEIPEVQRGRLNGVWARIRHCFAPQKPLVVSMNLSGLFEFPEWESQLVNRYHYIQVKSQPKLHFDRARFDAIMGRWRAAEARYEPQFDAGLDVDLEQLDDARLWSEFEQRLALKHAVVEAYYRDDFQALYDHEYEQVAERVASALDDPRQRDRATSRLLAGLHTRTGEKQRQLAGLAELLRAEPDIDLAGSAPWERFMREFGHEAASTHLMYMPTLRETPDLLIAMVRQLAINPERSRNPPADWQRQAGAIEEKLDEGARGEFREHLERLRQCAARAEDDDYLLQKATAQLRAVILELGARLCRGGLLERRDDVFYLEGAELRATFHGGVPDPSALADRVTARQAEFRHCRLLSPPPLIVNGKPRNPRARQREGVFNGIPASAGIATGTAVVIDDPFSQGITALPPNSVVVVPLVTPAFAYLLADCAALVTEIGGMTSHAAIVAREMGIPAVVGIQGIRNDLRTGMSVVVDGGEGRVALAGGAGGPA